MNFPRASGVLLHPTSLPGQFGIGDFGAEAYSFVDLLHSAGQTYWQVLPLGQTGYGDSPYQCFSAFAGNIYLISPQTLYRENLLSSTEIESPPQFPVGRVEYGKAIELKIDLLARAFERFQATKILNEEFETFCEESSDWLDDYALFRAIKLANNQQSWLDWDAPLRLREEKALKQERENLSREIEAQKFYQFLFFRQWNALKKYCSEKRIKIIGDVPIFVALDSADVWSSPEQFKLNDDGTPRVVAGVPPDYFSKTGQLWGNPIYDWKAMQRDKFSWWISRMKASRALFDVVRLDHFRGFSACWEVPATDRTAENGHWVDAPGKKLFTAVQKALGEFPIIAEDLGVITPDVEALLKSFKFPGMKILQYAFSGDSQNSYLPHNFEKNCVVYTGTHDNDTIVGWFWNQDPQSRERKFCLKYLKSDGREIHWDMIRAAFSSVADTAIVPMQDLLGFGNDTRMNLPSTDSGNWSWRCKEGDLSPEIFEKLRELTEIYGRKLKEIPV